MSKVSIYLTTGKPGEAIALCRLNNPPDVLVRIIAQKVLKELFQEAKELERQEKTDLARIRLKNAWLLKTTIENLLPNIRFEEQNSPTAGAHTSLLSGGKPKNPQRDKYGKKPRVSVLS